MVMASLLTVPISSLLVKTSRGTYLEISDHGDGETIDCSNLLSDSEDIEKRLSRMFSDSVSGVEKRAGRSLCSQCSGARLRMTQDDNVRVQGHRLDW